MTLIEKHQVMDEAAINRALRRIANEIVEKESGAEDVVLVGIHTGGVYLANVLAPLIKEVEGLEVPQGEVDITLYRDDLFSGLPRPEIGATNLPFNLSDKKVVLVDDVLYTGRTVRAALDALNDFGRPRRVRLAVLIDRGHELRELPIHADYTGMHVETRPNQTIKVHFNEQKLPDRVNILEKKDD